MLAFVHACGTEETTISLHQDIQGLRPKRSVRQSPNALLPAVDKEHCSIGQIRMKVLSRIPDQEHIPDRNVIQFQMLGDDAPEEVREFRESGSAVNTGRPRCAGTWGRRSLALG